MRISVPMLLLNALVATACSGEHAAAVWTAKQSTSVYASEEDTEDEVLFTLVPGDTCTPLRSAVMKVYLHTEIQCKNGRGWVIDRQNFDIQPARIRSGAEQHPRRRQRTDYEDASSKHGYGSAHPSLALFASHHSPVFCNTARHNVRQLPALAHGQAEL